MLLSSGWCLANSNGLLGISTQVSLVSFIDTRLTCVSGTLVWAIIMWFKHPRYLRAKENFISSFFPSNLNSFNYILPKVLFICGGDEAFCSNRGLLEKYITKHHKEFITFRAELAWEVISNLGTHRNVNALSPEEWLADFSDVVIILVESYGTVAELGAFSLSPVLRKKLLPILDKKFESHKSFINTGPVTWVNSESKFGPTIYTEFETILTCVPKINERLNRKIQSSIADSNLIGDYKYSPKIFLFFVLVVVSSLGPITIPEIINITGRLINYKNNKNISFVVSIGVALGIFKESKFEGVTHYSCVDYVKLFNHETMKGLIESIQRSRARSLSDLIMISKFKAELERIM